MRFILEILRYFHFNEHAIGNTKLNVYLLPLLVLESAYSVFYGVNTMFADALAHKVARASAGMVLAV